jgi:hypothetical protein
MKKKSVLFSWVVQFAVLVVVLCLYVLVVTRGRPLDWLP